MKQTKEKLNLKDTCLFAIQALERVEYVHSKNFLHRDIKSANFLVGNPDKSQIYLIDFGNAKKYRSSITGKHIPFKQGKVHGTPIFLSLNVLNRLEYSRRDDLESLGLVIINLYKGVLPWSNLKAKNIYERLEKIKYLRLKISNEKLCLDLPKEFCEYLNYVQYMNFYDNPDYAYLKSLFLNILKKMGEQNDLFFSWIPKLIKNNKSLPNLFKNIFSLNLSKMKSPENMNVSTTNKFDNKLLKNNKNRHNPLYYKENQNNIHFIDKKIYVINSNNNKNRNKLNYNNNMIYCSYDDNNKKEENIPKKLKTNNFTEKSNTYVDNQKLNRVELNRNIEMLDLAKYKKNKVQNKDKIKNPNVINLDITNNNYFTEFDTKKINSNNFDINNSSTKNNNNRIPKFIKINNINKLQINNNTYLKILKKNNSPKLKNYSKNRFNSRNMNEIKEYKIKNLYTNKISPNILSRNSSNLYQSNFIHNSNVNKDISIISKKLIKIDQEYIKQIRKVNKNKKLISQKFPKFVKKNNVKETRNLKTNYSYSQTNLYNPYFYKENGLTFSNSPNKIYI